MKRPYTWIWRYGHAVVAVFFAFAINYFLQPWMGHTIFFFYFPAILLTAWYQGLGPSILALLLSDVLLYRYAASVAFFPPATAWIRISLFSFVNLLVALFSEVRRKRDERSRFIVDAISDGLCLIGKDWTITYMNRPAQELTASLGVLVQRSLWEACPGLDKSPFGDAFRRAMKENTIERVEGFMEALGRWLHINSYPSEDGLLLALTDITERVEREAIIRESNDRQRLAIEAGHIGFWDWDIPGDRVSWSSRTYEFHGMEPGSFGGSVREFQKLIHPADAEGVEQAIQTSLKTKQPYVVEFRIIRPNGEVRWITTRGQAIFDQEGRPSRMLGASLDVTDRKKTEDDLRAGREALAQLNRELGKRVEDRTRELLQAREALYQSHKLEAVGRLAGGVAHDFNNLMTGIRGIAEELLETSPAESPQRRDIEDIIRAVNRANTLTRQLLAFSRQQIMAPAVLHLNSVIEEMKTLLQRMIGEHIEFKTKLDPELETIKADRSQIEQILLNLILNARDAMPQGGQIEIITSMVDIELNGSVPGSELEPGRYVKLQVSDSGTGILEMVQQHIFEPFFTTKSKEKGTGLGLATVYGIVKQNGGDIVVRSKPGEGATFTICLPVVSEASSVLPSEPRTAHAGGGAETILIVEDEAIVRRVVVNVLTRRGYQILEAGDPTKAWEIASTFKAPIHLLFTDVIMPGMNGRQLAETVQSLRPGIKVLYTSGFTEDIIDVRGSLKSGIAFIEKSFNADQLATKVRETLDT